MANKKYFTDESLATFVDEIKAYTDEAVDAVDWFGAGTAMSSNDDLDNYTTKGKYYAKNGTIVSTLLNCPTTSNFTLYVLQRTISTALTQMIIDLDGKIYTRSAPESGVWAEEWQTFVTTTDVLNLQTAIEESIAQKSDINHGHTVSQLSDLTTTAAELNYISGTTSNVQGQLDSLSADITSRIPFNNAGAINLASGDDLNNFTTPGLYIAVAAAGRNLVNSPISSGLKMYVLTGYGGTRWHQFVLGQNTSSVYHRMYGGSAWTAWKDLSVTTLADLGITATAKELNYVDGVTSNIQEQINNVDSKWGGCWVAFEDENGNPTSEPYFHWYEE